MLKRIECEKRVWPTKRSQGKTEHYPALSLRLRSRRGQKIQGGQQFLNTILDECSNWGAKHEMKGHKFQIGRSGTAGPLLPILFHKVKHWKMWAAWNYKKNFISRRLQLNKYGKCSTIWSCSKQLLLGFYYPNITFSSHLTFCSNMQNLLKIQSYCIWSFCYWTIGV